MNKKEELTPKTMSLIVINRMKYGGCSPLHQTFVLKCVANIFVLIHGSFVSLSILNVIFTPNLSVNIIMDYALMIVAFSQICAKYYFSSRLATGNRKMIEMIFEEFWSIEGDLLNKVEEEDMRLVYRFARICGSIYGFCANSALTLFTSHALYRRELIISIWIPNKHLLNEYPYYEIMISLQIVSSYAALYFSVVQVDVLFIYFICFLYVQLKLLQKKLSTIVKNNSLEENLNILKQCVRHHNKLIRFLHYLSNVYAKILLPTIVTNFFMFTLTIYGMQSEDSLNGKLKNFFIFVSILCQLFAYCYGGQVIQDQGSAVAETIYNLEWYDIRDISLRKAFFMIILRTRRPMQLSVGGILILEMRSLAMVIRSGFSFIAFLANVR